MFAKPEHGDASSTLSKDDVAKLGTVVLDLFQIGAPQQQPGATSLVHISLPFPLT
jgi:hypothetical protein